MQDRLNSPYLEVYRDGFIHGTQLGGSSGLHDVSYDDLNTEAKVLKILKGPLIKKAIVMGYLVSTKYKDYSDFDTEVFKKEDLKRRDRLTLTEKFICRELSSYLDIDNIKFNHVLEIVNLINSAVDCHIKSKSDKMVQDKVLKMVESDIIDKPPTTMSNLVELKCILRRNNLSVPYLDAEAYKRSNTFHKVYEQIVKKLVNTGSKNKNIFYPIDKNMYLRLMGPINDYKKLKTLTQRLKTNFSCMLTDLKLSDHARKLYLEGAPLTELDYYKLRYDTY